MKIVFAATEMVPFAKTGGLADVIGSLTAELQGLGHDISVFLPHYKVVSAQKLTLKTAVESFGIQIGNEKEKGKILSYVLPNGVKVFFVDHPEFYLREALYGTSLGDYPDNDRRFIFFQRGVLEGLKAMGVKPDILHCHDWQTGLIPTYLKTLYSGDSFFKSARTVFTVHNLAYQGTFPPDSLTITGLGWDQFKMERLEFYGKLSFLKGGLLDADLISTVSERYSHEIQTKEFGCGLEGVLQRRKDKLFGIVNGIDPEEWNPATDKELFARFSSKDFEKKKINKLELQKENGLKADASVPLVGMVARLVDQKGMDILIPALTPLLDLGLQFILLGTGEEKYHHILREFSKKNRGRASVHILFDPKMAKHIYAGCDLMLMPSYYEPCGLGQMIALRFGTIPVVRATGGLADTITPYDIKTGSGNGFVFTDYSAQALVETAQKALEIYKNDKKWMELAQNAMSSDFSWSASAKKYVKLYESIAKRKTAGIDK